MNVLISGASGLVGGNCLEYFKEHTNWNVVGTYFSFPTEETKYFNTLALDDPKNLDLDKLSPDVIIHCGALTHVDYCETNEEESFQKTVQSTINLIELCKKYNAKFVYISTDYVFDGEHGPYGEEDEVNPLSVYGKHKLEGEQRTIEALGSNALILRITNVYGREVRGKNFVARMIQNGMKDEVVAFPLPVDQYATPVNAYDIARALKRLLEDNKSGIYNIASTDFVNRIQLSDIILKHFSDHKVNIKPIFTNEMNQAAKRPLMGGLISKKLLDTYPDFKFTNVDDFVKDELNKLKN